MLFQPNFSDGDTDVRGPFLVEANSAKEAEEKANVWFHKQDECVRNYLVPLSGIAAIVEMIELKSCEGIILVP